MKKLSICLVSVLVVLCGAMASFGSTTTPYSDKLVVVDGVIDGTNASVDFWIDNYFAANTSYSFGEIINNSFQSFTYSVTGTFFGTTFQKINKDFEAGTIVDFAVKNLSTNNVLSLGEHEGFVDFDVTPYTGLAENPTWVSEWWNSVTINWGSEIVPVDVSLISTTDYRMGLAPVPIPATALLFCSSILGIVGIRRKISK